MFRKLTAKVGNMRKAKEFVVCPVSNTEPHLITIQSDNRIARVNTETGRITVSDGKGGHQGFHKLLPFAGAKAYDCPTEVLEQLANLVEDHGPLESGEVALTPAVSVTARTGPVNIFDL